ncbi:glycosyltransferase family 2 protein [Neptunomonas antarctica]|uniref:Glycosyltransferase involved in cell wall bisynthesis n=1 Tax=Neptunomonas antarctica TaxID=619304 RepID=A0A1N7J0S2_9GAMM|nr:glycosyltransferase family 2 protein [Neptunomonas antarctica]SIS42920.1 Glycosyltransferase involved in cell wall bisynthesis [Neptunomonas antarctica]
MKDISVYLVVMNEEKNIRRVLDSLKGFEDIVIVDSGSQDRTLDIAKEYTQRIYHKAWDGMAAQKEYAKSLCQHDWVLNLDADEELTSELGEQIAQLIILDDYNGASIPIREHFMGARIHDKTKKNSHIRLFRKSQGAYGDERFHESPTVQGAIKQLSGEINHYGEVSVEVKVDKVNRYSSGKALDKFEKGKRSSVLKLLLVFPIMFIKSYFLKRNCLNGRRGFISSMVNAFYAFLKEAKLYEREVNDDI